MKSDDSIRFLYRHYLSGITKKSQNAYYYPCFHSKADYFVFMNATAAIALKMTPEDLLS